MSLEFNCSHFHFLPVFSLISSSLIEMQFPSIPETLLEVIAMPPAPSSLVPAPHPEKYVFLFLSNQCLYSFILSHVSSYVVGYTDISCIASCIMTKYSCVGTELC